MDLDQVLIPKRLGLRIAALRGRTRTYQRPYYYDRDGFYGSLTYKPGSRTSITLNAETGSYNRSFLIPYVVGDAYTPWVQAGRPLWNWKTPLANGTLPSSPQAAALNTTPGSGLARLNVSLDALREDVFERIARRQGLDRVLAGLAAARRAGFEAIRINAVSIRGLTEEEIVPLAAFCRSEGFHLRFIEFMPLDAEQGWSAAQVLSGAEVREMLERGVGPLLPERAVDPGQPAVDYRWADGAGRVGFIDPVTQPFCDRCDRLRLTADGQFRNCLFSTTEWDVRAVLRSGGGDDEIAALLGDCVAAKRAAHGIETPGFERPARAMFQIGG
ncbi:MAG: GTP 3',8-cyclase MoaA [Planctomycetia bacterium]|nr:GTP 3',8-cyclase MoaA [Planctomycetia bacterium]